MLSLRNLFSSFSVNKVSVIHSSFPSDSHPGVLYPPYTRKALKNLTCVTADELHHLLLLDTCKPLDSDQIPTSLVENSIGILIIPITFIFNL